MSPSESMRKALKSRLMQRLSIYESTLGVIELFDSLEPRYNLTINIWSLLCDVITTSHNKSVKSPNCSRMSLRIS